MCISKVNGHAHESLVRSGQVRALDRYGIIRAEEAADFGRRRVWFEVADAWRNLSGVCRQSYPVIQVLHRFFIAISRAVVNCDDSSGLAPHPLVWSAGGLPKRRRVVDVVRNVAFFGILIGLVFLLLQLLLRMFVFGRTLLGFWSNWLPSWVLFIGPLLVLTWDLGVFPMLSFFFFCELWAGERFQFEKAVPRCKRVDRPISVSAVPFRPGIDIRQSCKLLVRYVLCLVALAGFSLVLLAPTTAGYDILVGISLVMVSPLGLVRLLMLGFWMSCFFSL